ncbi:lanthionine synthetase LanC family protein [Chryseobacterium sp. MYb264]|uniref:lanthionine synthetase LanC family protein n=1 Tax=Chryseobacterium sp. MYb264 TaxID=2745153 RepID=UPI002E15BFF3|nr:lanthionine synthetase LanC family protein [Chryseobacterium sp. MYb264]
MQKNLTEKFEKVHEIIESSTSKYDCLLHGNSAIAYYYATLYKTLKEEKYKDKAIEILSDIFDRMNNSEAVFVGNAYGSGLASFTYLVNAVNPILDLDFDVEEEFEEIDLHLFEYAMEEIQKNKIDCLHGALGIIHYFNSRGNSGFLDDLILAISEKAKISEDGIWFENFVESEEKDSQVANLSLSHGLTGILLILFESISITKHKEIVENTIKKGVEFLLSNSTYTLQNENLGGAFYSVVNFNEDKKEIYPRLAWCYGDLGPLVLVYKAAEYFNKEEWKIFADKVGIKTTDKLTEETSMVSDPYFCHGSSGVSMMYKKLYTYSPIPEYKTAQKFWAKKTVEYLDYPGFTNEFIEKKHSIIDGLIGINLALLSNDMTTDDEWLELFFIK